MKFGFSSKGKDDGSESREVSEDEKAIGARPAEVETLGHGELPPDPDAHLSEEERAKIVCVSPD